MATGGQESDDDLLHPIRKSHRKRTNILNSESESDSSSQSDIRPRTKKGTRQICDSDSDSGDLNVLDRTIGPGDKSSSQSTPVDGSNDSSDNEQIEKCSICLSKFVDQDLATPDICDHNFCTPCLEKWAKKMNTCPIDRLKFESILVRKFGDPTVYKVISVANKEPPEDDDEEDDDVDVESTFLRATRRIQNIFQSIFPEICTSTTMSVSNLRNEGNESDTGENNDTSSSESSDENSSGVVLRNICLRMTCQEVRNRRRLRMLRNRAATSGLMSLGNLQEADGLSLTAGGRDGNCNCRYQRTLLRHRPFMHGKLHMAYRSQQTNMQRVLTNTASSSSTVGILDDIMTLQSVLHAPGGSLQRDGTIAHSSASAVGQQCPLNPLQDTSSKCNNASQPSSSFASSSSSSSGSASSQCRDLYGVLGMLPGNATGNTDGYDTDSCSMVTHRSYGSSSVPEELRRDGRETMPSKETTKTHSDEEVDIYSDIGSTNEEETSMDVDRHSANEVFESRGTPPLVVAAAAAVTDGTDSSDNDLVIDEDMQAEEEEKTKHNLSNKSETVHDNSSDLEMNINESSNSSDDPNELSNFQTTESLPPPTQGQSPHIPSSNASHNSSSHSNGFDDSYDSMKKSLIEPKEHGEINKENANVPEKDIDENHNPDMEDSNAEPHSPYGDEDKQLQFNLEKVMPETSHSPTSDSADPSGDAENSDSADSVSDFAAVEPAVDRGSSYFSNASKSDGDFAESKGKDESKSMSSPLDMDSDSSKNGDDSENAIEMKNGFGCNDKNPGQMTDEKSGSIDDSFEIMQQQNNVNLYSPTPDSDGKEEDMIKSEDREPGGDTLDEEEDSEQNDSDAVERIDESAQLDSLKPQSKEPSKDGSDEMLNTVDLGIEDISDVASDDLNQAENSRDEDQPDIKGQQMIVEEVERNVAQLFENNSPLHCNQKETGKGQSSPYESFEDQEEGEIVDDLPSKKDCRELTGLPEDYVDFVHKSDVSAFRRIPKVKRDYTKPSESKDIPPEDKRTSVLGRVDHDDVSADISWKRLSQHSRERSYRDGRPKDESVLFRVREPKHKEKRLKRENKPTERKDDIKKQDSKKSNEHGSRDRKSERNQEKSSWRSEKSHSASDNREKEKYGKLHESNSSSSRRQDRDQSNRSNDRDSRKKDKRDKHRSTRETDKNSRDKSRSDEKYKRESERYNSSADRYDRSREKVKEKDSKHNQRKDRRENSRDRKPESTKKSRDDKKKPNHSSSDRRGDRQREREVRKVDDKLKIVVEQKESKKEKNEKHSERKHDKKYRDSSHHHERKKKEVIISPFTCVTPTPIESKEIFAKGDSIFINVNFNRVPTAAAESPGGLAEETTQKLDKDAEFTGDMIFLSSDDESVMARESFWQEPGDSPVNSPIEEKAFSEKSCSNKGDDPLTDSDDDLPDAPPVDPLNEDVLVSSDVQIDSMLELDKDVESFSGSKRRSPQPPSPPSPLDNDSYDPCEPTRSPSPPPTPTLTNPPLPSKSSLDHPKPPPSPELPPLPPGPEPTDSVSHEDGKSNKLNSNPFPERGIIGNPIAVQQTVASTQTPNLENAPLHNILMPPPSFPPRSSGSNNPPQLVPLKGSGWQINQPPPGPMMFTQNHVHPVIRGNFLPTHIPTMGMPPQNATTTLLPVTNSVPLMTHIRQLQLASHTVVPNNALIPQQQLNVPLNLPPMPLSHLNHPATSAMGMQHQLASFQSHPNSLSATGILRMLPLHNNQLQNIAVSISNQHVANMLPNQSHFLTPQNQLSPTNKMLKSSSPLKEKNEVVDMDVDSPYSPGASPSVDSNYDYSPPAGSPVQPVAESEPPKDPFDTLLAPDRTVQDNNNNSSSSKMPSKSSSKSRPSSNSVDTPRKKAKMDSKLEASSSKSHSVSEKIKLPKDQKVSNKKELFSKLDDTQLKILDDLPSSAVEMQVKEKFLKKLNRQERVVEEVKLVLKPYYKTREVSKDEYKDILRKCVPKICHNKSGDINPVKVKHLVENYVKKVKHSRKRGGKRHKS